MTIHLGLTHRRFNSIDRSGDNHHTTTSLSTDALSLNPIPTATSASRPASAACLGGLLSAFLLSRRPHVSHVRHRLLIAQAGY